MKNVTFCFETKRLRWRGTIAFALTRVPLPSYLHPIASVTKQYNLTRAKAEAHHKAQTRRDGPIFVVLQFWLHGDCMLRNMYTNGDQRSPGTTVVQGGLHLSLLEKQDISLRYLTVNII